MSLREAIAARDLSAVRRNVSNRASARTDGVQPRARAKVWRIPDIERLDYVAAE